MLQTHLSSITTGLYTASQRPAKLVCRYHDTGHHEHNQLPKHLIVLSETQQALKPANCENALLPHRYHGNVRAGAAALLGNRVLWKTLGLPERNEAAIAQADRVLKAALKVGPAAAALHPAPQCLTVRSGALLA